MKEVLVLMSTYNGEKYLREQIDSILAQDGVAVKLLVRDDGSTDKTLKILDEYKSLEQLEYYTGENLGPQLSFMYLLQHAPNSDYYAFADQDDVWEQDKLYVAVNALKEKECLPALYLSQTQLTDEHLNKKKSVIINPKVTFGESLIYKFAGGCTMVLNHKLRLMIADKLPQIMPMHDIWIYTMALAIDAYVFFDKTPHILYRQHNNNAVGQGQGFFYEWKERAKHFFFNSDERFTQAVGLLNCYRDIIPKHNMLLLQDYCNGKRSFKTRISILRNKNFRCSNTTTQILFWIDLLLNKY